MNYSLALGIWKRAAIELLLMMVIVGRPAAVVTVILKAPDRWTTFSSGGRHPQST